MPEIGRSARPAGTGSILRYSVAITGSSALCDGNDAGGVGGSADGNYNFNFTFSDPVYAPTAWCVPLTIVATTFTCYGTTAPTATGTATAVRRPDFQYVNYATAATLGIHSGINTSVTVANYEYRHKPYLKVQLRKVQTQNPHGMFIGWTNNSRGATEALLSVDGSITPTIQNASIFGIRYNTQSNDSFWQCISTSSTQTYTNKSTGVRALNNTIYNMSIYAGNGATVCCVNSQCVNGDNSFTTTPYINQTMLPVVQLRALSATATSFQISRYEIGAWGGSS